MVEPVLASRGVHRLRQPALPPRPRSIVRGQIGHSSARRRRPGGVWCGCCCSVREQSEMGSTLVFPAAPGAPRAESKASKWYAAATRQYMEETLSPRVFECLATAETPREELISAWRQLAAAVPGGYPSSCHALMLSAS